MADAVNGLEPWSQGARRMPVPSGQWLARPRASSPSTCAHVSTYVCMYSSSDVLAARTGDRVMVAC